MKNKRQKKILEIIVQQAIETQEQLLTALAVYGIRTTQATISRDIKQLHLVKEQAENGIYRYIVSHEKTALSHADRLQTIFRESVTSFDAAQNIVVLKTMPGLASAACAAIDGMNIPDLIGSLAGDDTALLIMRTSQSASDFCGEIRAMLL